MPALQKRDPSGRDNFYKNLMKDKSSEQASPKMSEYVEMMESYLLVREKSVIEQTSAKEIKLI